MGDTLLLDRTLWDLTLTSSGDIAVAQHPYALAQDVASAVKLFRGELYYQTSKGVPYWGQILGEFPPLAFVKAQIVNAALSVPGVVEAVCYISSVAGRELTGQVLGKDTVGESFVANF
jgi:hypothetical protein